MKKIIFDMDGVITTEQNYWNAAALTIWEHFFNEKDVKRMSECLVQIRNRVFFGDKTITLCKNIGVNSNWDLTYVVYSMAKILQSDDFGEVYRKIKQLNMDIMQLYSYLNQQGFRRGGELYNSLVDTFQQWYLGDSHYKKTYKKEPKLSGKKGLIFSEKPLHDLKKLKSILNNLKNKDYILGAATGRPKTEIIEPLKRWDLLKYFDIASVITFDDVQQAEKEHGGVLAKPHPFMFVKSFFGKSYPDKRIIASDYDKNAVSSAYAVGDAGADILSAKAAGMKFIAVLTGIGGQNARDYFVRNNADLILDSVLDIDSALA